MRPNICVVVMDAARAANFSCYGHERPTSPNTDALAAEDATHRLERAVSPSSVTFDSVTSFLAGLYPSEHQSGKVTHVNTDVPLLPEFLRDHGYRTGAVTSSPSTAPPFGFGRGVEEFDSVSHTFENGMNMRAFWEETKHLSQSRRYLRFARRSLNRHLLSHVGNALRFKFGLFKTDDGAREVTESATDFVGREDDRPWFLYLHYTETHMNSADEYPYSVPGDEKFRFVDRSRVDTDVLRTQGGAVDYDEETRDVHERLYDAAIHYLDGHVGTLVEELKARGEYEDTVFVVTADHGECMGERGELGHGGVSESVLRVPFVVRVPGTTGGTVSERVNTFGFYRTVTDLLEETPPDHVRGENLLSPSGGPVLSQDYSTTWDWSRYNRDDTGLMAYYEEPYKLALTTDGEFLFDVEADPDEEDDRSERESDMFERLQANLDDLLSTLAEPDTGERRGGEFDPAVESRLQELGYLE